MIRLSAVRSRLSALAIATMVGAAAARAQVPAGPPPQPDTASRPPADTAARPVADTVAAPVPGAPSPEPTRLAADGTRLRPGRWVYAVSVVGPGDTTTALGDRSVEVGAMTYSGAPAWLIVASGGRGELQSVDSLVVAQSDLRPLRWSSTLGLARLAAEIPGDTMFAATSAPTGKQSIVVAAPHDLVVNEELTGAVLELAPLAEGWRDSVHTLALSPGGNSVDAAELAVTGSELLTLPTGEVDCWVVELRSWRGEERLWVAKDSRTVVRASQPLPRTPGAAVERILIAAEPR